MATCVNFGVEQYFAFDPRSIPGCALWLDGADSNAFTFSTGSNISTWKDKSSNAYTGTASNSPTLVTSSINGLSAVTLNGTNQFFDFGNIVNMGTSSIHVFAVAQFNSGTNANIISKSRSTVLAGRWFFLRDGGNLSFAIDPAGAADVRATLASDTSTSVRLLHGFWNRSNLFLFQNGTQVGSNTSSSTTNYSTTDPLYVGAYQNSTGTGPTGYYLNGKVAEIIVYLSSLTTSDRLQIEGYLAWKWGTNSSLPTGHPFLYTPTYSRLFQPPDVDGNILWLDSADQGASSMTLSSTTITTWKDKSGNAKDFTSQLSPVIGTVNSRPIVDTTGGGCFTNGSFSIPVVYSGFISGYSTITAASNTWAGLLYGTPDAIFMLRAYQAVLYIWKGDGSVWGNPSSTGPDATSNAIYSFVNPSSAGSVTLYVNGTSNHVNSGVANWLTTGLDIGRWVNNSYPWKGYIGDVMFYSNAVSDADRQRLEGYLAWKMNLRGGLATSHPFRNFPPMTAAFHPMLLSNSTLWLDGADSTTNSMTFSGANITVWKDKSSNARNFTASGTGATLGTSPPGLVFTTNLYTSSHNASITANETMFLVFRSTKTSAPSFPIGSSAAGGRELGFRTTTSFGIVNNGVQWGAQQTATSNVTYFCKSTVTSGSATGFSINGAALSTSNISAFYGSTTTQLGREGASSFQYEGTICEVIAYSRVLSDGEQRQVEGYLAWKWGLQTSLPSNHPFYKFRS